MRSEGESPSLPVQADTGAVKSPKTGFLPCFAHKYPKLKSFN
jgi:hypothetical protein